MPYRNIISHISLEHKGCSLAHINIITGGMAGKAGHAGVGSRWCCALDLECRH